MQCFDVLIFCSKDVVLLKFCFRVLFLRYVVQTLSNGLSTLRIEPVKQADNDTTITCSADNGVGNPVVAEAKLLVLAKRIFLSNFIQSITLIPDSVVPEFAHIPDREFQSRRNSSQYVSYSLVFGYTGFFIYRTLNLSPNPSPA